MGKIEDLNLRDVNNHFLTKSTLKSAMSKSSFLGGFWRPDLRYLELIFWDETWYTSSLDQNLDPIFFFGRQHL
jgi:hypothetical protein